MRQSAIACAAGLFLLSALPGSTLGQWIQASPELPRYPFRDVDFINDQIGFAVGDRAIVKTEDGGTTWAISDTLTFVGQRLRGLTVDSTVAGVVAVVVGSNLVVGRSSSLGAAWTVVHTGVGAFLNRTCSRGGGAFAAFGEGGWLVESIDNALSWRSNPVFPPADMDLADCRPDGSIWAGGFWADGGVNQCCGVLMKSTDDGETWSVKIRPTSPNDGRFVDIDWIDESLGFALSSGSVFRGRSILWRTMNGGEDWEQLGTLQRMNAMAFANADVGVMVGDRIVLSTADGGVSWESDSLALAPLHQVKFVGSTAIAVGDGGLWRYENFVTTSRDTEIPLSNAFDVEVYPNPASSLVTIGVTGTAPHSETVVATLFDVLGRPIKRSAPVSASKISINVESLPPGLYYYRVDGDEQSRTGTVVVSR